MVDVAKVGVEDGSVQVHLLELEYVLSVVSVWLDRLELGLLFSRQLRECGVVVGPPCFRKLYKLLLKLNFVDVRDDLDAHRALALRQLQVLSFFESLDDGRDLGDTVAEDGPLLCETGLIGLSIFTPGEIERSDAGKERKEDFVVERGQCLTRGQVHAELHLLEGPLKVRESTIAPDSLEGGKGGLLDGIGIVEGLDGIRICAGRHEQVSSVDVDDRVLLVRDYELLEIMEGEVVVTVEVGALPTEDVRFKEGVIEFECHCKVVQGLVEHAKASIASASGQVELSCCLLFLADGDVEIPQGFVKAVELEIKKASEEVETCLLLFLAAGRDGPIEEPPRRLHLVSLDLVIDELGGHRVRIASYDADGVEAEGVLVLWVSHRCLPEELASHEVLLGVHLEDASAQPLVVDGRPVNAERADLLGLAQVL